MVTSHERPQMMPDRGILLLADFCRETGLSETDVDGLVTDETIDPVLDQHGALFGVFDDALPTAAELRAKGLVVLQAYDPMHLRSSHVAEQWDDDTDDQDQGPTWTMGWP